MPTFHSKLIDADRATLEALIAHVVANPSLRERMATMPILTAVIMSTSGSQELNDRRLTLVEGSALSERDLVRTNAHASSAILLLADRFSPSSHQEDLGLQFQARPGLSP